jgi:RNA polymerase II subunit A C-terminal domain phosphatase SSU72
MKNSIKIFNKSYIKIGLIPMLERNASVKKAPQRFQDSNDPLDILICFDDRVFEQVIEDLQNRSVEYEKTLHILNINTKDNKDEAVKMAKNVIKLCTQIENSGDWENNITTHIEEFEKKMYVKIQHVVYFI